MIYRRAPKLLCFDQGWCIARDDKEGETEYLSTLIPGRLAHWSPVLDQAQTTTDHAEALSWLAEIEKKEFP